MPEVSNAKIEVYTESKYCAIVDTAVNKMKCCLAL